MATQFLCPFCRGRNNAPEADLGANMTCGVCGGVSVVLTATKDVAVGHTIPMRPLQPGNAVRGTIKPAAGQTAKTSPKVIIGIWVTMILFGGYMWFTWPRSEAPTSPPADARTGLNPPFFYLSREDGTSIHYTVHVQPHATFDAMLSQAKAIESSEGKPIEMYFYANPKTYDSYLADYHDGQVFVRGVRKAGPL